MKWQTYERTKRLRTERFKLSGRGTWRPGVNFTAPISVLVAFIIAFSPLYHADSQVDDVVYTPLESSFSKLPCGIGLEALQRSLRKPKQSAILFTGQSKKSLVLALRLRGGDVELNRGPNFKYLRGMCAKPGCQTESARSAM